MNALLKVAGPLCAALVGCGYGLQIARVQDSFAARFGCKDAVISYARDGWHVEGCGRTAEYVCIQEDDDAPPPKNGGEILANAMADALFAGMRERCGLASSEETPLIARSESDPHLHLQRLEQMRGGRAIKLRAPFSGGYVVMFARPTLHRSEALLIVHTHARLPEEGCALSLSADGAPIELTRQQRFGGFDQHAALPLSEVEKLARAQHVGVDSCGDQRELDVAARVTLAEFADQFSATLAYLEHPDPEGRENGLQGFLSVKQPHYHGLPRRE